MGNRAYKQIVDPKSEQVTEIANGLNSFGLEQTGGESPARIAIVCEDNAGAVIGGAIGHSIRQRFYLTQLWVAEGHRSKGVGTELVGRIEKIAEKCDCKDVVVDTLNAKAVRFYEHLGYEVYMVNPNYIHGFDWCFLVKKVRQDNPLPSQETGGVPTLAG
ncbi:MAG: GNAT family N-acetyltransferase [Pseudomonadota bacterium]